MAGGFDSFVLGLFFYLSIIQRPHTTDVCRQGTDIDWSSHLIVCTNIDQVLGSKKKSNHVGLVLFNKELCNTNYFI
jgi:hypothetical protein